MTTPIATDRARAARLFHALSDETRLAVLDLLRDGERCVCELQDALGAAQSRLSFHLRVLKDAGLVSDRRDGRWSYYAIVPDGLADTHEVVRELAAPVLERAARAPRSARLQVLDRCCG